MRATSVMVLFLVFLQKGSFVSYIGSTVLKAVYQLSVEYRALAKSLHNDDDVTEEDCDNNDDINE